MSNNRFSFCFLPFCRRIVEYLPYANIHICNMIFKCTVKCLKLERLKKMQYLHRFSNQSINTYKNCYFAIACLIIVTNQYSLVCSFKDNQRLWTYNFFKKISHKYGRYETVTLENITPPRLRGGVKFYPINQRGTLRDREITPVKT